MPSTTLRSAKREDAPALADIYGHYVANTVISFETNAPDAAEMAKRLAQFEAYAPWLVYERDGKVLGFAYVSRHRERAAYRWSVDSAVYVAHDAQRGGVGRVLYTALFALAKLQGFCAVHAGITLPNAASVGLHEALGFVPVAIYPKVGHKFGAWHDVGWWQLELRPRQGEPPQILTPEAARAGHAAEWDAACAQALASRK